MASLRSAIGRRVQTWDLASVQAHLARVPVPDACAACGSREGYDNHIAVSRRLGRQWRLRPDERTMMNIQQGSICRACGNNLRGRSLADAILRRLDAPPPLRDVWRRLPPKAVLEINPAARLTPMLAGADRHVCTSFPEVDMHSLPFADRSFDLVVHSDTLEHVVDPVTATRECLRVAADGWVVFTVPVVAGRLTRRRIGRRPSFHGGDGGPALVHWEFGQDIVELLMAAGATRVEWMVHAYPYSAALACRREPERMNQ